MDKLLSVAEASKFLGCHRQTLYSWCRSRKIPFVRIGGTLRFRLLSLEAFLKRNEIPEKRWKKG